MLNKSITSGASHAKVRTFAHTFARTWAVALCIALSFATSLAVAQSTAPAATAAPGADLQCILAGRVDGDQRWAPQARGVELLDAQGKRVTSADKAALASVKQARISSPALLSACNGDQALAYGFAGVIPFVVLTVIAHLAAAVSIARDKRLAAALG